MTGENYRVDDLFKQEGVYNEALTTEEVIRLLENGMLKYLGDKVFPGDENKKHLYNVGCKKITMGSLKGYSVTHMCKLASVVSNFCTTNADKEYGSYFTEISNWELNNPIKATDVTVDLIKNGSTKVAMFISASTFKEISQIILDSIMEANPELLNGDGYANIKFIVSTGVTKNLGANLILKLSKALIFIKDNNPAFEYYCSNIFGKVINAHAWAFNTYKLANQALIEYHSERKEYGLSVSGKGDAYDKELKCARSTIMKTYIKQKGIKRGDMVLFSVVSLAKACPYSKIQEVYIGVNKETGAELTGDSRIRSLSYDSFFLAKVVNITDEFLVLKIRYSRSGSDAYATLPVAWNILLPNLKEALERMADPTIKCKNYSIYINKTSDEEFYRPLSNVPILLTEADCYTLSHPLFTLSMSGF